MYKEKGIIRQNVKFSKGYVVIYYNIFTTLLQISNFSTQKLWENLLTEHAVCTKGYR